MRKYLTKCSSILIENQDDNGDLKMGIINELKQVQQYFIVQSFETHDLQCQILKRNTISQLDTRSQ